MSGIAIGQSFPASMHLIQKGKNLWYTPAIDDPQILLGLGNRFLQSSKIMLCLIERLKRNRAGQVVLQLKSAFKDGTTHIVMSPLELMQRLAALVPRPRLHLIRFHGVLAPNAKLRR